MTTRLRVLLVIFVVLVLQTTVLSRLRVGGVVPDVMLLLAVCAGITGGAERGALVGFFSGMAIDLFLEGTPQGLSALVFSVVGYAVGLMTTATVRAAWWIPVFTAAVASAIGEALFAVTATVVGQPGLVRMHLLAVTGLVALFNAILTPVVMRMLRWAFGGSVLSERAPLTA